MVDCQFVGGSSGQDSHRALLSLPPQRTSSTRTLRDAISPSSRYSARIYAHVHSRETKIHTHARRRIDDSSRGAGICPEIRSRPSESGGRDRKGWERKRSSTLPAFLPSARDAHTKRSLVAEGRAEVAENRSDSRSESQFGKAWLNVPKRGIERGKVCKYRRSRNGPIDLSFFLCLPPFSLSSFDPSPFPDVSSYTDTTRIGSVLFPAGETHSTSMSACCAPESEI